MAPPRNHFAVETQQRILHVAVSAAVVIYTSLSKMI